MGIKVNLVQSNLRGGYDEIVELPAVPRVGEEICLSPDFPEMEVRSVTWLINDPDAQVRVRFR